MIIHHNNIAYKVLSTVCDFDDYQDVYLKPNWKDIYMIMSKQMLEMDIPLSVKNRYVIEESSKEASVLDYLMTNKTRLSLNIDHHQYYGDGHTNGVPQFFIGSSMVPDKAGGSNLSSKNLFLEMFSKDPNYTKENKLEGLEL